MLYKEQLSGVYRYATRKNIPKSSFNEQTWKRRPGAGAAGGRCEVNYRNWLIEGDATLLTYRPLSEEHYYRHPTYTYVCPEKKFTGIKKTNSDMDE